MKRILLFGLIFLLVLLAGLGLYTWQHWSPAGMTYPAEEVAHVVLPHRFRTSEEHDAAHAHKGGNPYILPIEPIEGGALLYYGAAHISNPEHPQTADITARWVAFQPTVALHEGRRGYFYGALIEPFAGLPESALVHKLARRDDVPLYQLEPTYADEVAGLLTAFSAPQIALYFFLRVYAADTGGTPNDATARELLAKRTDVAGLRGSLVTLADVDRLWQQDFPDEPDWRVQQREPRQGYMAAISDASRRIRGEHMVRILTHLVQQGERVFAVVGSGHVIRQEWNLRTLFHQEPAWDQPADSTHATPTSYE